MKRAFEIALLALALAEAVPVGAVASGPVLPPEEALREAVVAITQLDGDRLAEDGDYAREVLLHLDRIEAASGDRTEVIPYLEGTRLTALATLQHRDEIGRIVDAMTARRSSRPEDYADAFYATLATADFARFVVLLETASRQVPGVARGELNALLPRQTGRGVLRQLKQDGRNDLRVRLATALHRTGWPGGGDRHTADMISSILVEDGLQRGDAAAASGYAQTMSSTAFLLPMIVQRRYDPVLAPGEDRLALLARLLEQEDAETLGGYEAAPDEPKWVLRRAQFLRSVGRDEEALTLIQPFLEDVAGTARSGEDGPWLINEAAYALIALGRSQEGRALMEALITLPLSEEPSLISQNINYLEILEETGDPEGALAHAATLEPEAAVYASEYGRMWVSSTVICALAQLGRREEAGGRLEVMRAGRDVNPSALVLAYLCSGDVDAAAAEMVRRLDSDAPSSAILALQDYELSRGPFRGSFPIQHLNALRQRPEVRAALERVGRQLTLPLARTSWGNY
ncbi:hypothetical protein [Sphingosinicella terrae]|uniref:hypothetical protein n=1 Tax=Sphingosinicella terrae TaxID=2172047 RepID=UPI000E0DAF95|nr:hypothetical protein [Sphingosinicella terrae]